uniref:Uncharacterized protein n=1 Tax=Tanacetum cinerariifolium TaxID=118510 RepID=A0A6L2P0B0_TANCI|nr:hypothetical protein [Tanacetum cinerariifolium]
MLCSQEQENTCKEIYVYVLTLCGFLRSLWPGIIYENGATVSSETKFSEEETRDEEIFDLISKTPENTDDEGNGEENLGMNVGREEGQDEEDEADELYKDVNINLGRGIQLGDVHTTQEVEDSHVTLTPVNPDGQQQSSSLSSQFVTNVHTPTTMAPLPMSAPTITPSTIATITTTQQAPLPPTTAPNTLLQDLPNFGLLFGFDNRLKTLEANFSEFMQTNQFVGAVSSIPRIIQRYMDQRMNEAVKVAVQIQSDRLRDEAQSENDEFLKTTDENMQKIIKEQVKEQVKLQVSKILPKIEQTVNEQLEAEVLTKSSNSSKTSYAVAADLSEIELKKILIEKMEGNKSIHRSNEQRNLYKALVEAYESDKIILDTYGDTITLKRRRDDDADKDEEPFVGLDRGSKRRREGKEPDKSATVEEPMQTTFQMEEPSHPEFETGAYDHPIVEPSQHPEWFSQQKKPPTPDRDWNKTFPATHGIIQPWISELAKQSDSRSTFNELMDTPMDLSNFLMNRLKVDTLTPKLLAGPTYELMKGSCKSLVSQATSKQLLSPRQRQQIMGISSGLNTWCLGQCGFKPIGYDKHALWGISHWGRKRQQFYGFAVNRESARDVYSKRRIIAVTELKIVERHNYKHLYWITVRRDDDKLYKFKEGDFKRLRIQDIENISIIIQRRMEDLQLGVESYQKKLNLTKPDTYRSDLKRKEAYMADGTLTDVCTALDDRLKGIQMKYLPQLIWRKSDKDRAAAMIQAIDKRLKTRRIMRSLERFVGGRLYEGDFRML